MHHIHAPNASALHFSDSFSSILQTDAHGDTDMSDTLEQDLKNKRVAGHGTSSAYGDHERHTGISSGRFQAAFIA